MRTLVHLSDLHFGRVDARLLEPLVATVQALQPQLVAVSGDLTQRARRSQFRAARAFLDRLPRPQLVVPGNHDVPLYDVLRRFAAPLARFRHAIEPDLAPCFHDDAIAVFGLNTARALTFKNGRVNAAQLARMHACFDRLAPSIARIVVAHHPFAEVAVDQHHARVGRAELGLQAFAASGVELVLCGHLHRSDAQAAANAGPLLVQAGSATSTRTREEANGFNLVRIDRHAIRVQPWRWQGSAFVAMDELAHPRRRPSS